MALSKALEELLATYKDEGERKVMREQLEKHDFLRSRFEGNMRQEDYDRNLNKVKDERAEEAKKVEEYQSKAKQWSDWATKNVPKHEELVKNYGELEGKYRDLEEKYKIAEVAASAAAAAGGDGKVDVTELAKKIEETITSRGFVSDKDVKKIANDELGKMVTAKAEELRNNFYNTDMPKYAAYTAALTNLQLKYHDDFKEYLDPMVFSKFMVDEKIEDPMKAYERFTSEKRDTALKAKFEAETTARLEKEFASKHNLPGSGAPTSPELGPVQMARQNKTPYIPANAEAGDSHELAYAAAAELRSEGKV